MLTVARMQFLSVSLQHIFCLQWQLLKAKRSIFLTAEVISSIVQVLLGPEKTYENHKISTSVSYGFSRKTKNR